MDERFRSRKLAAGGRNRPAPARRRYRQGHIWNEEQAPEKAEICLLLFQNEQVDTAVMDFMVDLRRTMIPYLLVMIRRTIS
jgi:hypothetical protein